MKLIVVLMLVRIIAASSLLSVFAQSFDTKNGVSDQSETPSVGKGTQGHQITSHPRETLGWTSDLFFPLLRLLGVAIILGALLWWIDLPGLMKGETWTDRTVIALIIIFAFAAASLMNIDDKALAGLKDVTLIVVGFYFGAARSANSGANASDRKTTQGP